MIETAFILEKALHLIPMFLGLVLLLIALLILAIFFRKPLILQRIRMKHGRYSFDYQDQYKTYFKSNPHPYCFKDELLQHIINLKKSADLNQVTKEDQISSRLMDIPFDLTPKTLLATKGEPACFNAYRDNYYDFKLFGFPHNQFSFNSKLIYYFYQDKLFALDCIFEDFPQNKMDALLENIAEVLQIELLNEKSKTFYLTDNCRILFTNTGFRVSLKTYNSTSTAFLDVISAYEKQQSELKDQIENHFFTSVSN